MISESEFDSRVSEYKEKVLTEFRDKKKVDDKIELIATQLKFANIKDVILGISGGIDSSVVLGLLIAVKNGYIPDLKIHGYCITFDSVYDEVFDKKYITTLQESACYKDVTIDVIDCSKTLNLMFSEMSLTNTKHLMAQSSYALRYQMLFTYAQQFNGVTFGTTNRDEFEYVGWFGKSSDMVVDFQCITDWHKFEVIEAAKFLRVPQEIIDRVPTGDLIDNSSDEDNFGCSYDELAYFSQLRTMKQINEYGNFLKKYSKVLALHEKNIHKYQGQTFNPIFINH